MQITSLQCPLPFAENRRVLGASGLYKVQLPVRILAMPSFPQFNPLRLRSYVLRLPLCTRLLLTAMVALWVATIPFQWLREWGSLEPDKVNLTTSMFGLLLFGALRRLGFSEKKRKVEVVEARWRVSGMMRA